MTENQTDAASAIATIRSWAGARHLPEIYLKRWLSLGEAGRVSLLNLAQGLRMRAGQLAVAVDLLDEIALREQTDAASILAGEKVRAALAAAGSAPARAARLIDTLREIRFPRMARLRAELQAAIGALKLPQTVSVRLPADLASDELVLEIRVHTTVEMEKAVAALAEAREMLGRIVQRLGGSDEV